MRKNIVIILVVVSSIIIILVTGCSIQTLIGIVNNSGNLKFPSWDIGFNIPVIENHISMDQLLDEDSFLGQYLQKLKDATFDKVEQSEIESGGKYYFPSVNNFGLQEGDYIIKYSTLFPGSENLIQQGGLDASIDSYFTSAAKYSLPCPTWPVLVTTPFDLSNDDITDLDLSSLMLDINGDSSNDIKLKGIESSNASISLKVWIDDGGTTRVPNASDITLGIMRIENHDYHFGNPQSTAEGLVYTSTDFIYNDYLDFEATDDTKLNFQRMTFTLNSGVPQYTNVTLKIEGTFDFGDEYKIKGDIFAMNFNLGVQPVDISVLDTTYDTSNASAVDKLLVHFISSISMDQSAMVLDAVNTLPLEIDLTDLFDSACDSVAAPPAYPTTITDSDNGGVYSYYDLDNDGSEDTDILLSYDSATTVKIKNWTSGNPVETKVILDSNNSNFNTFIENGSGTSLRRPKSLFFVSDFSTSALTNQDIGILSQGGGLTIESAIYIPLAIKVLADKEGVDVLEAAGLSDFPISQSTASSSLFSGNDIKKIGIDINIENQLPIGLGIEFQLVYDVTGDVNDLFISLSDNYGNDKVEVESGTYSQGVNGEYYVSSKTNTTTQLTMKEDFTYKDASGDEYTYNGSLIDFINEYGDLKMKMYLNLKATKDPNNPGQYVTIRFSDSNYINAKIGFVGLMNMDVSSMSQ